MPFQFDISYLKCVHCDKQSINRNIIRFDVCVCVRAFYLALCLSISSHYMTSYLGILCHSSCVLFIHLFYLPFNKANLFGAYRPANVCNFSDENQHPMNNNVYTNFHLTLAYEFDGI